MWSHTLTSVKSIFRWSVWWNCCSSLSRNINFYYINCFIKGRWGPWLLAMRPELNKGIFFFNFSLFFIKPTVSYSQKQLKTETRWGHTHALTFTDEKGFKKKLKSANLPRIHCSDDPHTVCVVLILDRVVRRRYDSSGAPQVAATGTSCRRDNTEFNEAFIHQE